MPEFAAACFDLDGTLIDTEPVHLTAETACLAALGVDPGSHRHERTFGKGIEAGMASLAETYGLDCGLVLETYLPLWEAGLKTDVTAMAGAVEVLQWLDAHNVPSALVTSGDRAYVDLVDSVLGIAKGFGSIVTSDDVANLKPAPDAYMKAAEDLGVESGCCIGFEDSGSGVAALNRAGMRSVAVHVDYHERPELASASVQLRSLSDAVPHLPTWFTDRPPD